MGIILLLIRLIIVLVIIYLVVSIGSKIVQMIKTERELAKQNKKRKRRLFKKSKHAKDRD